MKIVRFIPVVFAGFALSAVTALPAAAAEEPFFSLQNVEAVVTLAFVLFVGVLIYYKVPGLLTGMLDKRAVGIRQELEEARALREEAQTILASYERKQKEVVEHSKQIIVHAKAEAATAALQAKEDLKQSIVRRLKAAEDQIVSAQAAAVREVRDTAIAVAVAAAGDVIANSMTAKQGGALIDTAIGEVGTKLN
ncbi:MAG: F0F1 ATP synthase subunit B [Alphaproteobacteria bacterium]|nr:F0F1 ATP synthase subunit B [Alphaproteobacteria bacterium]